MCPVRPTAPTHTSRRPSSGRSRRGSAGSRTPLRWAASLVAAGVVGTLALGQAPGGGQTVSSAGAQPRVDEAVRMTSLKVVSLQQHRGEVTGDGWTVYIANRTRFRPRRTVDLPPRIRARTWVVVDLDTGRLLGKHRARAKRPQASTMKLLTGVTAVRRIPADTRHRVTRFETSQICSCAGLRRGRVYRRDTLLAGMLLPSGNDAAEAVAGSFPRGRAAFYRAMNRTAQRLGARDTVAKNASGLTAPGSHSSARDLVVFLRAAVADRTLSGILGRRSATIETVRGKDSHVVWRSTDYVNEYPGSLGKSGWTTPAQNTLVVVTNIEGHRIAVATLGAPGGYSTSGARRLTTWASENFRRLRAVGRLPHS